MSEKENLEFKITFTETNIRWLLGETPINNELIAKHRKTIAEDKEKLDSIK